MKVVTRFNKTVYLVILIIVLLMLSCCRQPTDEELILNTHKKLNSLENYKAEVEAVVRTKESMERYTMFQWYRFPDNYRLELVYPEPLKGKTTIYDGERVWIFHPVIKETLQFKSFYSQEERRMFIGSFLEYYYNSKHADAAIQFQGQDKYVVLSSQIPGSNRNFSRQMLWFDINEMKPHKLEILNEDNASIITILFKSFEYNLKLDEDLFNGEKFSFVETAVPYKPLSVLKAENTAGFEVRLPGYLPDGFTLGIVNSIKNLGEAIVILNYNDDEGRTFTVKQTKRKTPPKGPVDNGSEAITVSRNNIFYDISFDKGSISWNQEGIYFEIIGSNSQEDLIRIMDSLR